MATVTLKKEMFLSTELQSKSPNVKRDMDVHSVDTRNTDIKTGVGGKSCHKVGFYTHALYKIWHRCYIDKNEFQHKRILLHQKDILNLCLSQDKTPHASLYVVPKDPAILLSLNNALIVDKAQRKFLIAFWRLTKDKDQYVKYVRYLEVLTLDS